MKATAIKTPKLISNPMSQNDSLLVFLFFAALLHIVLVLGVTFTAPPPPKPNRSLDITITHAPSSKPPTSAKLLAQDNQLGAGDETQKPELAQHPLPIPVDAAPEPIQEKNPKPRQEQVPVKPTAQKVLAREQAESKILVAQQEADPETSEATAEQAKPQLSPELLQRQIAQLGEKIRDIQSSENNKIKSINAVSTHKYVASQYVRDWTSKVERIGNLNLPTAVIRRGATQILTMDVAINADGSIYTINITNSSGNPALDDAAKQIVKMSAPFAPPPPEVLDELKVKVLVIKRNWKFADLSGMTSQ